jgi:mRNA interferase RelE/StbE
MKYEIILSPEAVEDLRRLSAGQRTAVREAMERNLRYEPMRLSRSRIKRLRGLSRPQYRLRVDEIRVFYDVTGDRVEVLAVIPKVDVGDWLREQGREP